MNVRFYQLPPAYEGRALDSFAYTANVLPLAAGAAVPVPVAMDSDADFLVEAIHGVATQPAAPTVRFLAPAITLDLRSTGSGRNLLANPVHWVTYVGTAENPFYLPYPKILKAAGVLTITFANLDAAQAYDVRLTLLGTKVFDFSEDLIQ